LAGEFELWWPVNIVARSATSPTLLQIDQLLDIDHIELFDESGMLLGRKRLSQAIGSLIVGRDPFDFDYAVLDLFAQLVLMNINVLELGDEFRRLLGENSNGLEVVTVACKLLIELEIDVLEEPLPL
jgi:hypothetical protein